MGMNINQIIKEIDQRYLRSDIPKFKVGDTVKMKVKVQEGEKSRLHPFEGTVIRKTRRGLRATFTVRKISFGEGVERTFPLNSPAVEKISLVRSGHVRRAKLYYLRDRVGRAARLDEKDKLDAKSGNPKPASTEPPPEEPKKEELVGAKEK